MYWGALFCLPFGFSFTALRISTIVLGLLGIIATYQLLKEIDADRLLVLWGTLVVAVNPLYFHLSLTFMTDVPFFALSMLAFLFLLRALRTDRHLYLTIGFLLTLIAILIRQLAIVIPLSFLVAYGLKNGIRRKWLVNALLPATLLVSILLAYPTLLRHTIGLPALYNRSYEPIAESAAVGSAQMLLIFGDRLFVELIYLGIFTLPFLILLRPKLASPDHSTAARFSSVIWPAVLLVMTALLLWQHRLMPLGGNILFDTGLGPTLLRDTYVLGLSHWPTAPSAFWTAVTGAALLGSTLLLRQMAAAVDLMIRPCDLASKLDRPALVFSLSAAGIYAAAVGLTGFLDRYLIWLLPLVIMCFLLAQPDHVAWTAPNRRSWIAVVLTSTFALFALAGTHDYLSWNRALVGFD